MLQIAIGIKMKPERKKKDKSEEFNGMEYKLCANVYIFK